MRKRERQTEREKETERQKERKRADTLAFIQNFMKNTTYNFFLLFIQ